MVEGPKDCWREGAESGKPSIGRRQVTHMQDLTADPGKIEILITTAAFKNKLLLPLPGAVLKERAEHLSMSGVESFQGKCFQLDPLCCNYSRKGTNHTGIHHVWHSTATLVSQLMAPWVERSIPFKCPGYAIGNLKPSKRPSWLSRLFPSDR